MDGNLGPQDELLSAMAMCDLAFEEVTLPKSNAGRIELSRRLDELRSAMATARTRLEVARCNCRQPAGLRFLRAAFPSRVAPFNVRAQK